MPACRKRRGRDLHCWRILPEGRYVVQSADHLRAPFTAQQATEHEVRRWELFAETAPEERSETFLTLAEAIEKFDIEFDDHWD